MYKVSLSIFATLVLGLGFLPFSLTGENLARAEEFSSECIQMVENLGSLQSDIGELSVTLDAAVESNFASMSHEEYQNLLSLFIDMNNEARDMTWFVLTQCIPLL